jgi:DNA-binding response OmpR family regulator
MSAPWRWVAGKTQKGEDVESGDTESPTFGNTSPTVFILEDEALIAYEIEENLRSAGFEIAAVMSSCVDGLKWLETNSPDAAVLDVELRDGNCAEIARLLHSRAIPFVVHSGSQPTMQDIDPIFREGRWVCKPSAVHEVREALASLSLVHKPPVDATDMESAVDPSLIAALRNLARSYRPHSLEEADQLVEQVLRTALKEVDSEAARGSLLTWLTGIMARKL